MIAIEHHMGTILNIVILIVLIAWSLFSDLIDKAPKEDTKLQCHDENKVHCQSGQQQSMAAKSRMIHESLTLWIKVLVFLQILTVLFTMMIYLK